MTKTATSSQVWQKRYPNLAFLLSCFPFDKKFAQSDLEELELWLEKQPLDPFHILYIIGLIDDPLPKPIHTWLEGKKERALIFVEEDLGAFDGINPVSLLENPQIHFIFAEKDPVEELAQRFPEERVAVFVPKSKTFDGAKLKRRSATIGSYYKDVLYGHFIAKNVFSNYFHLENCFDVNQLKDAFKKIPAIICGAGPSLENAYPILEKVGDKALIFGCGSSIVALTKKGIKPHFSMALDPNKEEFDRIAQAHFFEGPFLFSPRLHSEVLPLLNGPFGYMKNGTGGFFEDYLEKTCGPFGPMLEHDLGEEALSVTTLAINNAYHMGCDPIVLVGVDLAFTEDRRYAKGIEASFLGDFHPGALEERLIVEDMHGEKTTTLVKWVMEQKAISAFAKEHPDRTFCNAAISGLGFEGIQNISLENILKEAKTLDLEGLVHQIITNNPLTFNAKHYRKTLSELSSSLLVCEKLITYLYDWPDRAKSIVYEMDLKEQKAYTGFLEGIETALDHLLPRHHPHIDKQEGKKIHAKAKYKELLFQVEIFKEILNT